MKTSEFIKKVEELGYVTDKDNWYVYVRNKRFTVAIVSETRVNAIEANYSYTDVPNTLFDLIVEYAKTPIEEREEEKKYYWKLKGGGKLDNDMSHFNYQKSANEWFLSSKSKHLDIATQFTEKEFVELKSKLGIDLEFEKENEE